MRLVAHQVLGSTNTEALNLARQGERGPLWITAERQTAGRGRRGRAWISQPGNLYASLLLTAPAPVAHWPELSFVARLLAIKWPNDLLLEGAKFAGILIEGEGGDGGDGGAVAVGIGINCVSHPADTDYPATDLAAAGAPVSREKLFAVLSAKMLGRLAQWNRGDGFSTIRADWLARATGVGADIVVRLAEREIIGRFEALDETGGLMLRLPDGNAVRIAAGDVFISSASSAEKAS